MTPIFADTFYYLALVNSRDGTHARALEATRNLDRQIITTAWVLTEVGDALASPENRKLFLELLEQLRSEVSVEIVPASPVLFDKGVVLYTQRPDKAWTLTDCISFVVMEDRRLKEALTDDHHFEQAGFRAVLR